MPVATASRFDHSAGHYVLGACEIYSNAAVRLHLHPPPDCAGGFVRRVRTGVGRASSPAPAGASRSLLRHGSRKSQLLEKRRGSARTLRIERGSQGTEKKGRLAPALRWLSVQCSLLERNGTERGERGRTRGGVEGGVRADVVLERKRHDSACTRPDRPRGRRVRRERRDGNRATAG